MAVPPANGTGKFLRTCLECALSGGHLAGLCPAPYRDCYRRTATDSLALESRQRSSGGLPSPWPRRPLRVPSGRPHDCAHTESRRTMARRRETCNSPLQRQRETASGARKKQRYSMRGRESVVRTQVLDRRFFTIGRCPGDRVVGSGEQNMSVRRQGGRDSIV
jgi:hypothetical protein